MTDSSELARIELVKQLMGVLFVHDFAFRWLQLFEGCRRIVAAVSYDHEVPLVLITGRANENKRKGDIKSAVECKRRISINPARIQKIDRAVKAHSGELLRQPYAKAIKAQTVSEYGRPGCAKILLVCCSARTGKSYAGKTLR
jgi:hypothetical protein